MQVYQSKYLTLEVIPEQKFMQVSWSPATAQMTDEIFKAELTRYAEVAEQYRPEKCLIDTSVFGMTIVPETQEWVQANIHSRSLKAGIKKFAYIVSQDIFAQLSIEQTMEESGFVFTTQYFDNQQQAMDWLMAESEVRK
ncbi:MAG: hypothetical protein RMJ87_08990 [Cytophagales bacterium]|nr:hypothetical protein [Bernardetiaceae bacterium]MDW8205149.1 hypothetical protein [Cytophagales bacterium]